MTADIRTINGTPLDLSKRNERVAQHLADLSRVNDEGAIAGIVSIYLRPNGKWQVAWTFDPSSETKRPTDLMLLGALNMAQMQMGLAVVDYAAEPPPESDPA